MISTFFGMDSLELALRWSEAGSHFHFLICLFRNHISSVRNTHMPFSGLKSNNGVFKTLKILFMRWSATSNQGDHPPLHSPTRYL